MMASFAATAAYEITMIDCLQFPENYGIVKSNEPTHKNKISKMPFHHKILNSMYDRPFYLLGALGKSFTIFKDIHQMNESISFKIS